MESHLLTLRRAFVADHFHDLPGFVEERHGHNWEIEATLAVAAAAGPGVDTEAAFEASLEAWIAQVDYTLLNAQRALEGRNPTAESLAQWAYRQLEAGGFTLACVRIREKANYWAGCRGAA